MITYMRKTMKTTERTWRTAVTAVLTAVSMTAGAQTAKDGGISADMMSDIRSAVATTAADRALMNAIASNNIDDLARKPGTFDKTDTYFSHETPSQSITDQESSGRCWMFSGLNVLRADFAKRTDSLTVSLSQNYLFFYDQLEKANLFLQAVIDNADKPMEDNTVRFLFQNPISDGGTFCGVADLTEKYGVVPSSVMPETFSADNTAKMRALLKSKLREQGLQLRDMASEGRSDKALREAKTEMLAVIYRMLVLTLGEPPTEFTYVFRNAGGKAMTSAKTYTPQTFFEEITGVKTLNGTFIMLMNDPRRDYYKTYEVEYDRHTYDGHNWKYLNLPMEDIASMAIEAIKDGHKLYSSYDVGKFLDRKNGYCDQANYDYGTLLGTSFDMNKAQRIATYDSGSTHAMTLTAVDIDDNGKPKKWKVENSWGASWGQKGCLIMTNEWFEEYMFRLVIDKRYVPADILKMSEQKPVMVAPDDPLFVNEE